MATPTQTIRYLRACYEADNREASILNLRSGRVQHLTFLAKGGDYVRGFLDVVPLERQAALAAQKSAEFYRTERSLVFGSVMLLGSGDGPRGRTRVFAPLFFSPAKVEEKESYACLVADFKQSRLNTRALRALLGESEASTESVERFVTKAPQPPFCPADIYDVIGLLQEIFPRMKLQHLIEFDDPKEIEFETAGADPNGDMHGAWAHCMALVPNSPETRGVLTELNDLADTRKLSSPLQALLTQRKPFAAKSVSTRLLAPCSLNRAQQHALYSCRSNPLTVLYGPPGTGKTFTTAAIALDHIGRGKSVLLVARTDQALDVLQEKISAILGKTGCELRGGRGENFSALKSRLESVLMTGAPPPDPVVPNQSTTKRIRRQLEFCEIRLREQIDLESEWATKRQEPERGRLRQVWHSLQLRMIELRLRGRDALSGLMATYHQLLNAYHESLRMDLWRSMNTNLEEVLRSNRKDLANLVKALLARTNQNLNEQFAKVDLRVLFKAFPLWMTTLADIHELLPFSPDIVDLVILDEATQCDMASCLPAFFRAKRVAITGDPKQLRHFSFLSGDRQEMLSHQCCGTTELAENFDFRHKSILDLVLEKLESATQVIFLNEHYRSTTLFSIEIIMSLMYS